MEAPLVDNFLLLLLQVTTGESRARMGEVAHQRSDFVILADSDPGLEDSKEIIQVGWTYVLCIDAVLERAAGVTVAREA
jgi:hypothetical protein